jgi:hypothetical protein
MNKNIINKIKRNPILTQHNKFNFFIMLIFNYTERGNGLLHTPFIIIS